MTKPKKSSKSHDGDEVTVLYRTSFHNVIYDVLRSRPTWKETDSDTDWDFNWADIGWIRDFYDHIQFDDRQRVNHFRNHYELTRKDLLVKNLKRMKRQLERSDDLAEAARYSFFPSTYVLPQEYSLFLEEFKKTSGATWIMKPIGSSQGKGIFLFNKLSQVSDWKKDHKWKADGPQVVTYIAQRYVQSPYTVGGKKFDLRLYCLVTSYSPLQVWIHRNGFCRFSNTRYSEATGDLDNAYMHLTNHSIQKHSENYNSEHGMKWGIHDLKVFLMNRHGEAKVAKLFEDIQGMIVRSLLAVQQTIIQDKHSYELYGYDVLFDDDFKPWLLEVNASPSITKSNEEDHKLKFDVLNDLVDVVDIEGKLRGDETNIRGFDLVYDGDFVTTKSMLGCYYPSLFKNEMS
uniref:Tubulin--tyrosine ligase-like protein 9 n=2 Tax=Mucochytrium quahogii TaxID=96639 RepID=A0A7S2WSR1_9STRA|mmetsp:Transcript_13554/g.22129  ORF Transcript_13554/g.22129 Transcript_13554/m.22129 type:complete len:401 (-) Transcript_13554:657-1859(-)